MPSLTCKGGVGEGFAVPDSKSVQADAKRYYPIVSASTNSPKLAANRQCLLPNPPYPPLHKGGMAGAHIDTRYIQTDKQQFIKFLGQANMRFLLHSRRAAVKPGVWVMVMLSSTHMTSAPYCSARAFPSSRGSRNRAVERQSARPESLQRMDTLRQ